MEVDFGVYGVRNGQRGWQRATSYHPNELGEGTAEEKEQRSASGTGRRLLNGRDQSGASSPHISGDQRAVARATRGGQARSPFQH